MQTKTTMQIASTPIRPESNRFLKTSPKTSNGLLTWTSDFWFTIVVALLTESTAEELVIRHPAVTSAVCFWRMFLVTFPLPLMRKTCAPLVLVMQVWADSMPMSVVMFCVMSLETVSWAKSPMSISPCRMSCKDCSMLFETPSAKLPFWAVSETQSASTCRVMLWVTFSVTFPSPQMTMSCDPEVALMQLWKVLMVALVEMLVAASAVTDVEGAPPMATKLPETRPSPEYRGDENSEGAIERGRGRHRDMYIVGAQGDLDAGIGRLVGLLLEIEANPQTLDLGAGGDAPRATYRPTVGLVYYGEAPGFDPRVFLWKLEDRLRKEGERHLLGPHTVELSPHARVEEGGRVRRGLAGGETRAPYEKGWYPGVKYPARHLHHVPTADLGRLPAHFSLRGGFSWYVLPVAALLQIRQVGSMAEFNALVASVFYDPGRSADAPRGPFFENPWGELGVPPLPATVRAELLRGGPAPEKTQLWNPVLVYVQGRFEVAGAAVEEVLHGWAPPPPAPVADFADLSLVDPDACSYCRLPLWGEFYAVAPAAGAAGGFEAKWASAAGRARRCLRAPVCRWCYGCFPHARPSGGGVPPPGGDEETAPAIRTEHPRGIREAFSGSHGHLLPFLGVPVRRVALGGPGRRGLPVYVMGGGGGGWIFDPSSAADGCPERAYRLRCGGPGSRAWACGHCWRDRPRYLCLKHAELAGHRLPAAAPFCEDTGLEAPDEAGQDPPRLPPWGANRRVLELLGPEEAGGRGQ